ncbi:MAG TPA: TetR/AcrR family transcriptional regulator [Longimicrobiales bacterium]|nr:TetR/AcrR family transcriptional regulator [Longimicrobiales bacterium]
MNNEGETRDALVQAARGLFARHGYEGTSVRAVTSAAGANLGAITYHFGSKRELYDRVVASVVAPLADRVAAAVATSGPVLDRAEGVVLAYFDHLRANPDLPQLMMQELVLSEAPPVAVAEPLKRVQGALAALVLEGQAQGVIRAGPAPVLGIFILSVPVHLAILHRALKAHTGLDLLTGEARDEVVASAVAFVRSGLAAETA